MFSSKQIRSAFIDFFKERGHTFVPSAPVVPIGDDTLLFINAGMNQFKDIFLGLQTPPWPSAVNSQKCIRVSGKHNDLEEVGMDTYHHTFFEMLGNWSFDDYFKAETIEWAWKLLTEVYDISPDRLWATVFAGDPKDGSEPDTEAAELWTKVTSMPVEHVLYCGKKDNFWEMGSAGPCGPCSEIHVDLGPEACDHRHIPGHKCAVNAGCARFIELWNLVFIQFNRTDDGTLERLLANYVDTGAGLERIAAVLQKKSSNYDTDLFAPIISAVADLTGHKYTSKLGSKTDNAFRVIADHIRSLTFSITDGVTPSNEGRGYVMRRILRRAARFGRLLGAHEPFMYKLVPVLAEQMGGAFADISQRANFVATVIKSEEESFGRTLDRGLEIFSAAATATEKNNEKIITGQNAFQLYDTYGFPLDLTQLMARERGLDVDTDTFDELMDQQRTRARAAQKGASLKASLASVELPATDDSHKYNSNHCSAKLLGWITPAGFCTEGTMTEVGKSIGLILDRTCFYADSGGQVGDVGTIRLQNVQFVVEATEKIADCVVHQGKLVEGKLTAGLEVVATVGKTRNETRNNHTATHLLQWSLRQVLGDSVKQQGSLVCHEYLRFDFTYPKAMTVDETRHVERLVREKIAAAEPVTCVSMPIDEAKKLGAIALFGEKYGSEVRIVCLGAEDASKIDLAFSREFCGGTHVANTSAIGGFKIVKEESISAGVRRITAITGAALTDYLIQRSSIVDEVGEMLKVPPAQITARVQKLLDDNKKLAKELKNSAHGTGTSTGGDTMTEAANLLQSAKKIGQTHIVVGTLSPAPVQQLRQAIDMIKKKAKSAAIVFGIAESDSKVTLLAGFTDDLVKQGLNAGNIIGTIAPIVDGAGGGRPQMAQAGGKTPAKLSDALTKASEIIELKLATTT